MNCHLSFDTWLYDRLRDLNTDENVFGPYIKSIVESDEDQEEKIEGLDGLLVELQGDFNAEKLRDEILERWSKAQSKGPSSSLLLSNNATLNSMSNGGSGGGDVDDIISALDKVTTTSNTGQLKSEQNVGSHIDNRMDNLFRLSGLDATTSTSASSNQRGGLGADSALRAAILSQYRGSESSSDEDDGGGLTRSKHKSDPLDGFEKNDNVEKVMAEQREIKERARLDHTKKKERDKEDRAKQKQAAQDRKEKAKKKAQKTERKR